MLGGKSWKIIREDDKLPTTEKAHAVKNGEDLYVSYQLFDFLESCCNQAPDEERTP